MAPSLSDNNISVTLRRVFRASRQQVFSAWITTEALEAWLKPGGKSMTVSRLDVQVGGSFCFDLADGTSIVGTYLDIIPPEKLAFTWSGKITQERETVVTLHFLEQGELTELVLIHEQLDWLETPPEFFRLGWQQMLQGLFTHICSFSSIS
jgi:uncharacterized protein YndB with AHSA1/START domain